MFRVIAIMLLIAGASVAGCVGTVDGPGGISYVVAAGHASFGPRRPDPDTAELGQRFPPADENGWIRCPYVSGTTMGLSVHAYVDMAYDPASETCRDRVH